MLHCICKLVKFCTTVGSNDEFYSATLSVLISLQSRIVLHYVCRKYDYENYLSTLLIPSAISRAATFVLRAFYIELAQVLQIFFSHV